MLITSIDLCEKYDYLEGKFRKAYDFLKNTDLKSLPAGRVEIDGDDIFANVQEYTSMPEHECRFGAHNRYFDIQYVVTGKEYFGSVKREGMVEATEYDEKNDLIFYEEPEYPGYILLNAGDLAVVASEDAHKPRCMAGEGCVVRKIVIKVRV